MYTCILIRECNLYEKEIESPKDIFTTTSIVGACIDHDLVLLSNCTKQAKENRHKILDVFEKDEDTFYEDLLIIKTDTNGDPIDLNYAADIENLMCNNN